MSFVLFDGRPTDSRLADANISPFFRRVTEAIMCLSQRVPEILERCLGCSDHTGDHAKARCRRPPPLPPPSLEEGGLRSWSRPGQLFKRWTFLSFHQIEMTSLGEERPTDRSGRRMIALQKMNLNPPRTPRLSVKPSEQIGVTGDVCTGNMHVMR